MLKVMLHTSETELTFGLVIHGQFFQDLDPVHTYWLDRSQKPKLNWEEKILAQKGPSKVFPRLISEALCLTRQKNAVHHPQGSVSPFQDLSYFEI